MLPFFVAVHHLLQDSPDAFGQAHCSSVAHVVGISSPDGLEELVHTGTCSMVRTVNLPYAKNEYMYGTGNGKGHSGSPLQCD